MSSRKLHLLIIDPQNDFCDLPEQHRPELIEGAGRIATALPVPGAHADMLRVAQLIERGGGGITDISVTLDSHQRLDIAHPTFWCTSGGGPVAPFTRISAADVREGTFVPRLPAPARERAARYLDALESRGRYKHTVWPVHCEIGTWGQNVHEAVRWAYNCWEERTLHSVTKLLKGTNPWTEHYSAIQAEVPDESDEATLPNLPFLDELRKADRLYITGEAGSHCVKATTEHLVARLQPFEIAKLVLVTDCMSPVTGFEAEQASFFESMRGLGVGLAVAAQVEQELRENGALEGKP